MAAFADQWAAAGFRLEEPVVRGQWVGFYPYPFIDVAALGYSRVLLNAAVMLAAFVVLGLCIIGLDRWQGWRLAKARTLP